MSWLPRRVICFTRHSIESGLCPIVGLFTISPGRGVSPVASHLLRSRPERTPQKSVARAISSVVRFMVNSMFRTISG